MKKRFRVIMPLLVIAASVVATALIVKAKPAVERVAQEAQPPLVRVVRVSREPVSLNVTSNGIANPVTRSTLVAQVGARVTDLSSDFAEGSFFRRGQILARLDARDFELAVTQAEAGVAQAEVQLEREEAEAAMAIEEWGELGSGEPSTLAVRAPQLAQARAEVKAAQAALAQTRLQLERTVIRAPFAGRVDEKLIDLGQFATPGTPLARVYSTDRAEVALKVPQDELAFLDVTLGKPNGSRPRVILRGKIGSKVATWPASIVRSGARIDPQTRMVSLIAEVDDPFALDAEGDSATALPMGLYLNAEIEGMVAPDAIVVPRSALRPDDRMLVVTEDNRLDIRDIGILRIDSQQVVVSSGLESGEQVCISPLTAVVEGMRVRVQSSEQAIETAAPEELS